MTNLIKITYQEHKMRATMFCNANYLIYINEKDEIIAYQLDDSTIKKLQLIPIQFPVALPNNTAKTMVLNDIWSSIIYEKDNISDVMARIIAYEMKIDTNALAALVKDNLHKSTPAAGEEEACPAFVPISKEVKDKLYQCDYCVNKIYCINQHTLPI